MRKAYRIISIEAADIYRQEQENGGSVGYKMPESKSDAYFKLFKIYLDNSLDLVELEKAYARICRKKFSFQDKKENEYAFYDTAMDYIYQAVKNLTSKKAKEKVLTYVKELLVLTDGEKGFLSKLKDKTYIPELLFDN